MKRFVTAIGVGSALTVAAVAGGFGVALAHDGGNGGHGRGAMMSGGMSMPMEPAAMQDHMKQMLGDEGYAQMQAAMTSAMGEGAFDEMMERMSELCGTGATGGMQGGAIGPGHSEHHPAAPK